MSESDMITAISEFDGDQNKILLQILEGNYTQENDTFSFELDLLPDNIKIKLHTYVNKIIKEKAEEQRQQERKKKRREADQKRREKYKQQKAAERERELMSQQKGSGQDADKVSKIHSSRGTD